MMPPNADKPADDRVILALLGRRDPAGFDLAYRAYAARLRGFLIRMCKQPHLADDLLQHTFLRLAERGPELRPDSDLRAWLFTVARNAFLDQVRGAIPGADAGELEALFAPEADVEARLLLGDVEGALLELGERDRELLLLVGVEGFTPGQTARLLGVDPVTLRQRLSRARSRLLNHLQQSSSSHQAIRRSS